MAPLEALESRLKEALSRLRGRVGVDALAACLPPLLLLKRACDRARPTEIDGARAAVESWWTTARRDDPEPGDTACAALAPILAGENLSRTQLFDLSRLCERLLGRPVFFPAETETSDPLSDTMAASADTEPRADKQTLARGSALGRYVVVDLLGRGGMGQVYAAYDPELDRKIALKVMRPEASARAHDTEGRARLLREAQAMARVAHPNVIAVYDVGLLAAGEPDEQVFIAMELVEGSTLRQWLETKPRGWREVLDVFVQAGRGLAAAHAAGLVHRDFKPDNALVGTDGRVRVLDFGLVRAAGMRDPSSDPRGHSDPAVGIKAAALDTPLTRTGALMGTPAYMSPEQMTRDATDARSDQFSFCVALHQALYGARPFAGNDLVEMLEQMKQDRVQPAPRDKEVPARLRQALLRGLRYDPAARFGSMDALLAELARDPSARRRRWLSGGAMVAVLALATGGVVALRHQQQSVCKGGAVRLAGLWDRAAIEKAFGATGRPFAGAAAATVARAFEGFGARWAAMHEDACAATRLRGEQSEELLDLRMQCLSLQLEQARATAQLLARADAKIVENAAKAVGALPAVEDCANAAALKSKLRPPADPATRAKVEAVRTTLAKAKALDDANKIADGIPIAAAAATDAKAIGYAPVEAESLVLLGQLQRESGDTAAALKTLADAVLAAEASHHDEVAAQAWTQQVMVAYDDAKFDQGREWARWAQAAVARTGDDRLKSALENALGALSMEDGKFPDAMAHYQEALRLRQKSPSTPVLLLASTLSNIGNVYLQEQKLDEALASYQQALTMKETVVGKDHPAIAASLNNLANAYTDKGRYAEAIDAYRRALAIWQGAFGPNHRDVGMAYMNLGALYDDMGRYDDAVENDLKALAIQEKALGPEHPDVAATRANLGRVYVDQHRPQLAIATLEQSRAVEEKVLGNDHPDLAATLLSLGQAHEQTGEHARALADGTRALAIREKLFGKDHAMLAQCAYVVGRAQLGLKHTAAAVAPLERAVALLPKASSAKPGELAEARFDLARALWDSGGDRARAKALATEARDDRRARGQPDAAQMDDWLARHK